MSENRPSDLAHPPPRGVSVQILTSVRLAQFLAVYANLGTAHLITRTILINQGSNLALTIQDPKHTGQQIRLNDVLEQFLTPHHINALFCFD